MRHISCADDETKLEREVLREIALVVREHDVVDNEHLDVLDLAVEQGEGIDLGVEGVGEEGCVVAL
jgi:hypothetical protein